MEYASGVTVHGQISPKNLNNLKNTKQKGTDASERVPERDVSVPFLAKKSHEYPIVPQSMDRERLPSGGAAFCPYFNIASSMIE
jgi:hypothetical protein